MCYFTVEKCTSKNKSIFEYMHSNPLDFYTARTIIHFILQLCHLHCNCFKSLLEGMARYTGLFLAPGEGSGQRNYTIFNKILNIPLPKKMLSKKFKNKLIKNFNKKHIKKFKICQNCQTISGLKESPKNP